PAEGVGAREVEVTRPRAALLRIGKVVHRINRLAVRRRRRSMRRLRGSGTSGTLQVAGRLVPCLAQTVVDAERLEVSREIAESTFCDELGGWTMEQHSSRREQPAVHHRADVVMGESEALADLVEDPVSHQLLESLRGLLSIQTGRRAKELEIALA